MSAGNVLVLEKIRLIPGYLNFLLNIGIDVHLEIISHNNYSLQEFFYNIPNGKTSEFQRIIGQLNITVLSLKGFLSKSITTNAASKSEDDSLLDRFNLFFPFVKQENQHFTLYPFFQGHSRQILAHIPLLWK